MAAKPTSINFEKVYTVKSNATRDIVKVVGRGEYQREELEVVVDGETGLFMIAKVNPAEEPDCEEIPAWECLSLTMEEELGLGRSRRDHWGEDGMQASDVPEPATKPKKKSAKQGGLTDTEKLMLETIPKLEGFTDASSIITGKAFLAAVKTMHNVETTTSRSLMVSLRKKNYFRIIGKKSGQKHTTIQLLDKGAQYLGLSI